MTVAISAARVSALASSSETNHPIILWDNTLQGSGVTLSTNGGAAASDGAPVNATLGSTYSYWKATPSAAATAVSFVCQYGVNRLLHGCGIAAHNLHTIGATVTYAYSPDGTTWTTIATVTPTDASPILLYGVAVLNPYYRIRISGITDTTQVRIGVISFGQPMLLEHRYYKTVQWPLTPNDVELQSNVSEGGNLLGSSVVRRGGGMSFAVDRITPVYARGATWLGFERHYNAGKGFFFAWRPATYGDCAYAWRAPGTAAMSTVNSGLNAFLAAQMQMRFFDV